jgi:hypothetical protein
MANVLRILLYRKEEDLACYLIAFYDVAVDLPLINQAVNNKQYKFLKFMFAFDKNLIEGRKILFVELFSIILQREGSETDLEICC